MRILSQDGKIDVNYDLVALVSCYKCKDGNGWFEICMYSGALSAKNVRMAKYSTEEKARKAMEMLHEAYTGIPLILQNVDISDDVMEMFKKWKKQGICVVSENQPSKVEYVGNILFQFPQNNEIEV